MLPFEICYIFVSLNYLRARPLPPPPLLNGTVIKKIILRLPYIIDIISKSFYKKYSNMFLKQGANQLGFHGGVWHSGNARAYTSRDRAVKTAPMLMDPPAHSPYAYLQIGSREAFICGMP